MNYCTECGAEVEGDETYCPECGSKINEPATAEESTQEKGDEEADTSTAEERTQEIGDKKDDDDVPWKTYGDVSDTKEDGEGISLGKSLAGILVFIILMAVVGTFVLGLGENVEPDTSPSDTVNGADTPPASGGTDSGDGSGSDTSDSGTGDSSSSDPITHEIGEPFTVGTGDNAVRYTVKEATTADQIGGEMLGVEADGSFVIVTLEVENTGTEPFIATTEHLELFDAEGRTFSTATEAGIYIEQDSRYNAGSISFEELQPGLSVTRNVVYDVPTGQSYGLRVKGTSMFSTAEPHHVLLGQVE
jgi:hypothetical protein